MKTNIILIFCLLSLSLYAESLVVISTNFISTTSLNVQSDFGAKGDGKSDDTIAIQHALDAVQFQTNNLSFPAGDYIYSSTLNLSGDNWGLNPIFPSKHGVKITGAGQARTRLIYTGDGIGLALTNKIHGYDSVTIEDLSLIGPYSWASGSIGLAVGGYGPELGYNGANLCIQRVGLYGWSYGAASTNIWVYSFANCEVYSNKLEGLRFVGCHSVHVVDTFIKGYWGTLGGIGVGFHIPMNAGSGDNGLLESVTIFDQTNAVWNEEVNLTQVSCHWENCSTYLHAENYLGNTLIGCYIIDYSRWTNGYPALLALDYRAMRQFVVVGPGFDTQNSQRAWFDCYNCRPMQVIPTVIGAYQSPIELFSGKSPLVIGQLPQVWLLNQITNLTSRIQVIERTLK